MPKDEIQAQVEASHSAFTEWRNEADIVRLLALLAAGLAISLRKTSQTEGFIEDVLKFAELAYTAGMLHSLEKPNAGN
ncbi:hypothetical protein LCGC14_1557740 [marine sediment metagenome]|uniref:Uncharacterized protein n=1 Tax=marine sediment metagenome TaxID=412755 RepID=A0A0F9J9H1_9ZZZZ